MAERIDEKAPPSPVAFTEYNGNLDIGDNSAIDPLTSQAHRRLKPRHIHLLAIGEHASLVGPHIWFIIYPLSIRWYHWDSNIRRDRCVQHFEMG